MYKRSFFIQVKTMYAHFLPHFVIIRPGTNGNAFLQMHVSHMHLSRAHAFSGAGSTHYRGTSTQCWFDLCGPV
jgi:hypothetical protein